MMFQGEEWEASTTAPWFADFEKQLADSVRSGRLKEFASFTDFADPEKLKLIPDPCSRKPSRLPNSIGTSFPTNCVVSGSSFTDD